MDLAILPFSHIKALYLPIKQCFNYIDIYLRHWIKSRWLSLCYCWIHTLIIISTRPLPFSTIKMIFPTKMLNFIIILLSKWMISSFNSIWALISNWCKFIIFINRTRCWLILFICFMKKFLTISDGYFLIWMSILKNILLILYRQFFMHFLYMPFLKKPFFFSYFCSYFFKVYIISIWIIDLARWMSS